MRGIYEISKDKFIEIINNLGKQLEHDRKCSDAFSVILPNDYISLYDNGLLFSTIIDLLKEAFDDNIPNSNIEYFIYELNFGKEEMSATAITIDDKTFPLTNAEELYNLLMLKYEK